MGKKDIKIIRLPIEKGRPAFKFLTGNPENHEYLDWYRQLVKEGEVVPFSAPITRTSDKD